MVNQLRAEVNARLVKKIESPIRNRCRRFVAENQHVGAGVKARILQLFAKLADEIAEAASGPAEQILLETFNAVETEILKVFNKHPDPLDTARDAIIDAHENYIRRSDAQRRKQVLADVEKVLQERPDFSPDDEQTQAA